MVNSKKAVPVWIPKQVNTMVVPAVILTVEKNAGIKVVIYKSIFLRLEACGIKLLFHYYFLKSLSGIGLEQPNFRS